MKLTCHKHALPIDKHSRPFSYTTQVSLYASLFAQLLTATAITASSCRSHYRSQSAFVTTASIQQKSQQWPGIFMSQ
jgi:hypothetical protein